MARRYSNTSVETTLVSGIGPSITSIQINDTGGLPPSFPYSLILDPDGSSTEVVTVTNLSGSTLTVIRGEDGTAAQSHDAGTVVIHGVTARDLSEPQIHMDASDNVHGVGAGASVVGTTTTQVLTNKTISGGDNTLTNIPGTALNDPLGVAITVDNIILTDPDPDIDVAATILALTATINDLQAQTLLADVVVDDDTTATGLGAGHTDWEPSPGSLPEVATTFTAPPSGVIRIDLYAGMAPSNHAGNSRQQADVQVRVGGPTGTIVRHVSANPLYGTVGLDFASSTYFSGFDILSGLTPGETYHARVFTRNTNDEATYQVARRRLAISARP